MLREEQYIDLSHIIFMPGVSHLTRTAALPFTPADDIENVFLDLAGMTSH